MDRRMETGTKRPNESTRRRVLVADAYAATRAGIRAAIAPYGYAIAGEAADARGAVEAAARERPDAALVSLSLPGGGVETIRAIAKSVPDSPLLAFGEDDFDDDAVSALAAGACGLVSREDALERLPTILDAAFDGYAFVPSALLARVAERAERERRGALWRDRPRAAFSPRERQVLDALRRGASTADIAIQLGLSAVTVRRYVSGVLHKVGVPDRHALSELLEGREAS
jgi:two-component system nitrate/nitrite response regulator NarL